MASKTDICLLLARNKRHNAMLSRVVGAALRLNYTKIADGPLRRLEHIVMSIFYIDGALTIQTDTHTVEYEPGQQTGSKTLYLRVKGGNKNVPIFVAHIDEVIEMLQRGKKAIEAIEQ